MSEEHQSSSSGIDQGGSSAGSIRAFIGRFAELVGSFELTPVNLSDDSARYIEGYNAAIDNVLAALERAALEGLQAEVSAPQLRCSGCGGGHFRTNARGTQCVACEKQQ